MITIHTYVHTYIHSALLLLLSVVLDIFLSVSCVCFIYPDKSQKSALHFSVFWGGSSRWSSCSFIELCWVPVEGER